VNTLTRKEVDSEAFRARFSEDIPKFINGMTTTDPS
jgi:hypothetical protein